MKTKEDEGAELGPPREMKEDENAELPENLGFFDAAMGHRYGRRLTFEVRG